MTNRPSIAILLEFGFHDIKKYIHSGFAKKLSEKADIIWLAIDKGSAEFDDYFRSTGFPIVYFKETDFQFTVLKIENINQAIRSSWMLKKNFGAFHNYKKIEKKTVKSCLMGNGLLKYFCEKLTLKKIKSHYYSSLFESIFKTHNVKAVFGTGYGSVYCRSAYVTAHQKGIKTFFLVGSWKDLYINNFIPFNFLDGIFVWSLQMKKSYLSQMPYLHEKSFFITGNPTFDLLKTSTPKYNRDYYVEKYKISNDAYWLLYTMMPPGLVNDEIETIILVAGELLKKYTPEEKTIIVRRNPNHSKNDFIDRKLPPNLVMAEHYCTYDKEKDMIVQSIEGELEWIDLLHHCEINMSVPSTVTLEFLTLNKPVLNIGFGPDGNPDERIRQHFEAGFYKPMFQKDLVKKVLRPEQLNENIEKLLLNSVHANSDNSKNKSATRLASDQIIEKITEQLTISN